MGQAGRASWSLFYRGNTRELLAATVDGKRGDFPLAATGAVVGALVFSGRLDEAEAVYGLRQARLSRTERIEARFFLAVGFTRHSDERRSRKYLLLNLKERGKVRDPKSLFYLYQGLGFRGFFTADYRRGLTWAGLAAQAASRARFPFGKAFSLELLGHCQVQAGEISEGLRSIELAIEQAKLLGDGGLVQSFTLAHTLYMAQMGRDAPAVLGRLMESIEGAPGAFPYSRANLLLELSRQFRIRGDLVRAKGYLDQASPVIYQLKHRRCAAVLKLRYASLLADQGDCEQALQFTRGALAEIHKKFDRALEIEIRGMEARLLSSLGLQQEAKVAEEHAGRLAGRTGKYVHMRMQHRKKASLGFEVRVAEDPLGDLVDSIARGGSDVLQKVLASGYLGFCPEILSLSRTESVIVLRTAGDGLLIFDRGSVSFVSERCTPLMRKFLLLLSRGDLSKEDAIRAIWGYAYSPLRHDSLIYRLAARTRLALGRHAHWIQIAERGYRLAPGVRIHRPGSKDQESTLGPFASSSIEESAEDLNFRQLGILKELRDGRFLDVRSCRKIFGVSEITARRDLVGLLRLGELQRLGKGRAVKYRIVEEKR